MLPLRTVHFRAFRDDDADVWIATSEADRITTEAATKDEIVGRLKAIVLESRRGGVGPLTILIDWQEFRTVEHQRPG